MKISIVQFKPELNEKEKNIDLTLDYAEKVDCDILIFPELALSGYYFLSKEETKDIAEPFDGEVIAKYQELASNLDKIIVIGFPEKDGEKVYNSAAILFPDESLSRVHRKTHLFYKERYCFDEGDTGFFVIEDKQRDVKIGTMICYDWRFPEAARTLALRGADIIVCPSNLVTPVWGKVMPARAIENKVYLAVANRIGKELRENNELFFNGESAIYGYNGERLAVASVEDESVISAEIEPERTRNKSFNEFNDIFTDRRPQYYEL